MADLGVDYSFARPGGAAIRAAGFNFVCRYLASDSSKRISAAERDDLHNNSLPLVLVFEDFANNALQGEVQGVKDAQEALAQAEALGLPSDRPIYFAVDFDATEAQQASIDAYMNAAGSIIGAGRVGVYGGFYVVKRCLDNGSAKWAWQTVAWSGGQVDSRVHIYQNGQSAFNGGADINEARQADFGQWPVEGEAMAIITTEHEVAMSIMAQGTQPQNSDQEQFIGKSADQATLDANATYWLKVARDFQAKNNIPTPPANQPLPDLVNNVPTPPPTPTEPPADVLLPTPANQEKVNIFVALWRALFG